MTKTEAVQAALAAGITSPKEIVKWVMDNHQIEMSPAHVSNTKSQLSRAEKPKPRKKAVPSTNGHAAPSEFADMVALREIVRRHGTARVHEMADFVA